VKNYNYGVGKFSFDYKIENEDDFLDIYVYKNGMKNTRPIELVKGSDWKTSPPFDIKSNDNPRITIKSRDNSRKYRVWIAFPPYDIENQAPSKPHLLQGPSEGFNNTSYSFSAMSEDPDGNRIQYTFKWGDGSISRTGWFGSGKTVVETHKWNRTGTYSLVITATDEHGAYNSSKGKIMAVSWLVKVPSGAPLQPLIDLIEPNTMLLLEGRVYDGPINISQSNIAISSNNTDSNIRCCISDSDNYTIGIMNAKNVTINRLNVSNGLYGINLRNCSNCSILNSNISIKKCGKWWWICCFRKHNGKEMLA
jgi:hypothetical protein